MNGKNGQPPGGGGLKLPVWSFWYESDSVWRAFWEDAIFGLLLRY